MHHVIASHYAQICVTPGYVKGHVVLHNASFFLGVFLWSTIVQNFSSENYRSLHYFQVLQTVYAFVAG